MKYLKEVLYGAAAVVLITAGPSLLSSLVFLIKDYFRKWVVGYDVRQLLEAKDIASLYSALEYKKSTSDYEVKYTRSNAAIALGQIADLHAMPWLVRALSDPDARVVQAAGQAIGQVVYRCLRQPLLAAIQSSRQAEVQALLGSLSQIQTRATQPLMAAFQKSPETVFLAALGMLASPQVAEFAEKIANNFKIDIHLRTAALQTLLNTGDPRAGNVLVTRLTDPNPGMRIMAAQLLGDFQAKAAAPAVFPLLDDNEVSVRKTAIVVLGKLGYAPAADKLLEKLPYEKGEVLLAIVEALGVLKATKAAAGLYACLFNLNADLRRATAKTLAQLGESKWQVIIKGNAEDFIRLGQSKEPMALQILLETAKASDAAIRLAAIHGLDQLADAAAGEAFLRALKDAHPPIRKAALEALGSLKSQPAADEIRRLLVDADKDVRIQAAASLAVLGEKQWQNWVKGDNQDCERIGLSQDPKSVDLLVLVLDRREAAAALSKSGNPKAVPVFLEQLKSGKPSDLPGIIACLGELADPRAVAPLGDLLVKANPGTSQDTGRSLEIIAALKKIGDKKACKYLVAALADRHESILVAVAEALASLKDPKVCPSLPNLFSDSRPDVRAAAAKALAQLGEPQWNEWIKGDAHDFKRVAKSGQKNAFDILIAALESPNACEEDVLLALGDLGDKRAIPVLQKMLLSNSKYCPASAAKALAQLGETQWQNCINPDYIEKLYRLAKQGLPLATQELIQCLGGSRGTRTQAAQALIKLAGAPDQELKNAWSQVFQAITQPHADSHSDDNRSSDCSHSDHSDSGVGLSFPKTYDK